MSDMQITDMEPSEMQMNTLAGIDGPLQLVGELFPTLGSRILGTVIVLVVLVAAVRILRWVNYPLKRRFNDIAVEMGRATAVTVLATAAGVAMVFIWGVTDQVLVVLDVLEFTQADIVRLIFSVALIGAAYSLTRASKQLIRKLADERGALSRHQKEVSHHIAQLGIFLLIVILLFALWQIDITNLLLGAGFLGLVLGFAARQTLSAVLAGFVVLFSRPFGLGDWVKIGEYEGVVQDINVFNTHVKTYDDELVMIPNDVVTSTEVINRSRLGRHRIHVDVGVDYDTDIDRAVEVAEAVLEDAELALEKPTPHVVLTEFGESAVVLRLRFWIDNPSASRMWRARTEVIEGVKAAFEREGIEIPFPQRVVASRDQERIRLLRDNDPPDSNGRPEDGL